MRIPKPNAQTQQEKGKQNPKNLSEKHQNPRNKPHKGGPATGPTSQSKRGEPPPSQTDPCVSAPLPRPLSSRAPMEATPISVKPPSPSPAAPPPAALEPRDLPTHATAATEVEPSSMNQLAVAVTPDPKR